MRRTTSILLSMLLVVFGSYCFNSVSGIAHAGDMEHSSGYELNDVAPDVQPCCENHQPELDRNVVRVSKDFKVSGTDQPFYSARHTQDGFYSVSSIFKPRIHYLNPPIPKKAFLRSVVKVE